MIAYTHGTDAVPLNTSGDPIVLTETTYRYITDVRGSVLAVVNADTGVAVQELSYGPYGEVLSVSAPLAQPFGFAGGLYDRLTELVRFGARGYDPETARWTAKDPIGFAGGDSDVYAYVGGDPVNGVDPSGLVWQYVLGGAMGGIFNGWRVAANGGSIGEIFAGAGSVAGVATVAMAPMVPSALGTTASTATATQIYMSSTVSVFCGSQLQTLTNHATDLDRSDDLARDTAENAVAQMLFSAFGIAARARYNPQGLQIIDDWIVATEFYADSAKNVILQATHGN